MNKINNAHSCVFLNTTDENSVKQNATPLKKQASNIAGSQPLALRDISNQTHVKSQAIPLKQQVNNTNSQPLALRDITNQNPPKTQVKDTDSQSYSFRDSTNQKHDLSHSVPFEKQSRTILKSGTTPSVEITNDKRELDPAISKIKAKLRIDFYYTNGVIEVTHKTPLNRVKTMLQGTSAPRGCQAAHASLTPNTNDGHTAAVIQRIVEVGVTPNKTGPFLKHRINLSTPEKTILDENHYDENFVTQFIISRLPKDGIHSILAGTQYNWNCNATFENPDESNQYDSRLEKTIAPLLKELQQLRLDGTDTPEESTEKLVAWLMKYYKESIVNIKKQIELLEQTTSSLDKMRAFEQQHLSSTELPPEEFAAYLKDVSSFLEQHTALMEKKVGCPTCNDLKHIRDDFSFLKKLNSTENAADHFLNNRRHLIKQEPFSAEGHLEKFNLYLLEAETQMEAVDVYTEPCTVQGLSTAIFGVYEDGIRRAPTDTELKEQIYAISAPLPSVKNVRLKKIKFDTESEMTENVTKKQKTTL